MKNIHLIPTDKPSRLYYNNNDLELQFCELCKETTSLKENRNIYITSAEEIKEGDYVITPTNDIIQWAKVFQPIGKKIILTTDGDLIKEGVQAIDDEFLEWFVKNRSCEKVDVENERIVIDDINYNFDVVDYKYKIIIPEEKQKQHLINMMKTDEELGLYEEETKCYCGHTTYCDCIPLEVKIDILDFNQIVEESKQETLEEVAEKYAKQFDYAEDSSPYIDFIEGAKWQIERSYSKEEVLDLLLKMSEWPTTFVSEEEVKEWFEQFKKK